MKAVQDSHNNAVNRRTQADIAKINELGAGQRLVYSTDAQERISNKDRSARAGEAAANRLMQKEIAAMPGAQEKFYAYLGNGNVKAGFDYFVKETAEGKGDEALMQFVLKTPDILSGISPALRKIIEQRITERFVPAAKNTPTGKAFE